MKTETQQHSSVRCTLPALSRLTQDQCIKVLLQSCELQLSLSDLIQANLQQAVLMKLAQVMDSWVESISYT